MNRNFRNRPVAPETANASPPSETWLFAQEILGKPIPNPFAAQAEARAKRAKLEWLAEISTEHERELKNLLSAEAEARRKRKQLEWLATISTEHERKLRNILAAEAETRAAQKRHERFYESYSARLAEWAEVDHPRQPKGTSDGGQWVAKGGGGGSSGGPGHSGTSREPNGVGHRSATPDMLDLAHAWWQTNNLLQQSRRDLETLPARIASEQAKLGSRDGHSNVHAQNLATAQRDLEHAKALVPQLEKQLHELAQQYHDSGYDEVPYSTWTPGETLVGGKGIEDVGLAVAMGGSPAGLKPTGIEFDIALAATSVFQLGRAALRKAATAAPKSVASEPAALKPYGGAGGGHHVPAKKAFEGAAGYNAKDALAIPRDELSRLGVVHSTVTGAQQTLYREFAKRGQQLTWDAVERIETEALVRGGLNSDVARATVKQAIDALKRTGIPGPTRIPWGN